MRAKISRRKTFWTAISLSAFLFISYFIKLNVEDGFNYTTTDSLLGILIFHNIFVLSAYVLIIAFLLATSVEFN